MRRRADQRMKIPVVDVGGSHVKCAATGHKNPVKFKSGPNLTPGPMVQKVIRITRGWRFDAVSNGCPGVVRRGDNVDAFPGGFRLWERPAPASARGNYRRATSWSIPCLHHLPAR